MTEVSNARGFGRMWSLLLTAALLLGASLPAVAGEIYSWRTEDGGYAYTDDAAAIPTRYRDQVETRKTAALASYPRYTATNAAATEHYAERLAERVERLRLLNGTLGGRETLQSEPAPRAERAPDYVNLRTGPSDRAGVDLSIPSWAADDDSPLVVETVFVRLEGSNVIQRVQVTMRGDRIVAINKPRPRNWNISDPIDEAELLEELQR
jgi:hypothetical protein